MWFKSRCFIFKLSGIPILKYHGLKKINKSEWKLFQTAFFKRLGKTEKDTYQFCDTEDVPALRSENPHQG